MRRGRSLARGTGGCKELHVTMSGALTSGFPSRMNCPPCREPYWGYSLASSSHRWHVTSRLEPSPRRHLYQLPHHLQSLLRLRSRRLCRRYETRVGRLALANGDWGLAQREFERVIAESHDPDVVGEALFGLGNALLRDGPAARIPHDIFRTHRELSGTCTHSFCTYFARAKQTCCLERRPLLPLTTS